MKRSNALRDVSLVTLAPFGAAVVAALFLLPGYADHLTPDGISYLSIAESYARGDIGDAINAYWSPLFSWVLAPFVAIGVPSELAAKLVLLASGLGVMAALRRLARTLGADEKVILLMTWALAPFAVAAAFSVITPDLLVAIPVILYADLMIRQGQEEPSPKRAAVIGLLGGAAYLTKLFALPAVALHLLLVLGWWAYKRGLGEALRGPGISLGVMSIIVGAWGAVLTASYGFATLGTAANSNLRHLTPGSWGFPTLWDGFLRPPNAAAVSAWEDPSLFDATPAAGEGGDVVTTSVDAGSIFAATGGNLVELASLLLPWVVVVALVIGLPLALRKGRRSKSTVDIEGVALTVGLAAIWVGGLALSFPKDRYLWVATLLLVPIAAITLHRWRGMLGADALTSVASGLLVVGLLPLSWGLLTDTWEVSRPVTTLVGDLEPEVDLAGVAVASNSQWGGMMGICHHMDCNYYGVKRPLAGPEETAEALRETDVELYFVIGEQPPPFVDEDALVTRYERYGISIYDVSDLTDA